MANLTEYTTSLPPGQYYWTLTVDNGQATNTSSSQSFEFCDTSNLQTSFASSFFPADAQIFTDGSLSALSWAFDAPQFEVNENLLKPN